MGDSKRIEPELDVFRAFFEHGPVGNVIAAPDGAILRVNAALASMLGYSTEELEAYSLSSVIHPDDLPADREGSPVLSASERVDLLPEQRLLAKDGRTIWVNMTMGLRRAPNGTVLHLFAHVVDIRARDITSRERIESERARLAAAIAQAGEAVMVTNPEGAIEYVNPAFEAVTGYAQEEVLGQNPRLLKSGVQDEPFYRSIWETISRGAVWRGRLVNRKKDGSLFHEDATISAVRDLAGVITSYVAVKRDVTANLALQEQFLHAQKMEAVGRLAGGVAHDFNNVLSVILSYAEMIGGDLKSDDPLRADIGEIRTAALRAAELTRQLLAFSRHQMLQGKVLNLNESLAGMEKMLGRLLGADIDVTLLPGPALWNVEVDPGQVEQILMNLAVNARDAMSHGGKLTVETANVELDDSYASTHHAVPRGSYVELAVSDTGSGMDKDVLARIFEPFYTTKERGKGTGLGLATVFGIVKQSGGHIFVYSEPGEGTTFKVYLPKAAGAVVDPRPSVQPEPLDRERGSATILLVEDEDQLRTIARNILRRQGYVVLDAPNGGEALLICEQHKANIDLLLTDVVLPRMSGRQLAERLAPMRPKMKVLYMSGYTDDAILQHGILDSGVAFLQKPLTPTSLLRKVREVLGMATARE